MATILERRTENGERRYQVKVRLKGYPPQAATFRRKKEAERWAQATEAALRERRYFKTAESERRTVGELIARYMREILPMKATPATQVRYLAALSHAFAVAIREWGWLDDNPVRKVRRPQSRAVASHCKAST